VRQRWAMRSGNKTPRYTPHWDELPRERADRGASCFACWPAPHV